MKKTRDILLKQHKDADPKLDRIRQSIVSGMARPRPSPVVRTAAHLWRELIWPSRRIWAGLAAIWIALAVFHWASSDPNAMTMTTAGAPAPTPERLLTLREKDRLLSELIGAAGRAETDEPRNAAPRPRSERPRRTVAV